MTALRAGNGGTHGSRPTGCGGHPGRAEASAHTRQNRSRAKRDVEDAVPYDGGHEPRKTGRRGRRALRIDAGRRGRQNSEIFSSPCPLRRGCGVYIVMAQGGRLCYDECSKLRGGGRLTVCITALESAEERRLFEDVYRACCGRMLALARRRLSAQADAEDAVQQSFLALAEHFSRLAKLPKTQLEAYLVVTVERKCIDILRQQARRDGAPFDETAALVTPPPCGEPVADAMGRLSPRYREALLLRYGCGYSARETAALMDMSYGAGQKLQQRAKAALRQELEKEGVTV